WADHIAGDLVSPRFRISVWEAVGRRLRANYLWIFILLALSWSLKIYIHPIPISSAPTLATAATGAGGVAGQLTFWSIFFDRARVGLVPGEIVVLVGVVFNFAVFFVAFSTLKLKGASSEVQPLESLEWHPLKQVSDWAESSFKKRSPIRR